MTQRSKKFTHKVCKELLERFFTPFAINFVKERSKMGESESAAPKICPLLSGLEPRIISVPSLVKQEPRKTETKYFVREIPCRKYGCEFWSEKEKVCSFVRKVEYESLLEKIIQSKK